MDKVLIEQYNNFFKNPDHLNNIKFVTFFINTFLKKYYKNTLQLFLNYLCKSKTSEMMVINTIIYMINTKINIDFKDDYGYTPLLLCIIKKYNKCVYKLIMNGADINEFSDHKILKNLKPEKYKETFNTIAIALNTVKNNKKPKIQINTDPNNKYSLDNMIENFIARIENPIYIKINKNIEKEVCDYLYQYLVEENQKDFENCNYNNVSYFINQKINKKIQIGEIRKKRINEIIRQQKANNK